MFSKSMQKREASLYLPPERQARKILTAQDLYDMFNTRMTLHRRAYQHKTKNIIGIMICDALVAANDELMFTGENGVELRMSETINDMVAYTELTDNIFQMILRSSDIRLKRSRDILNNVLNRDLYDCVAQTQIKVVNLDYGMKNKDPVQNVRFYSKRNVNEALEIDKNQVSFVLPDTFAEQYVRVYCTVMDSYLTNVIEESFAEWCDENSHPQSQGVPMRRYSIK